MRLILEAVVTKAVSPIKCEGDSCVVAATKLNTAQNVWGITSLPDGTTTKTLVAAVLASRYPDNVFVLTDRLRQEVKAFAASIQGKGGVITIIGSHSHTTHDANGVKMANERALAIMNELKRLGVKAEIKFVQVDAKTVKGGLAGATTTWRA